MHLLISIAISFGLLILGLAGLIVLRARGIDPVSRVAGLFLPTQTTTGAP